MTDSSLVAIPCTVMCVLKSHISFTGSFVLLRASTCMVRDGVRREKSMNRGEQKDGPLVLEAAVALS